MTTSFLSTIAPVSLKLTKKRFLIRVVNNMTINLVFGMNRTNIWYISIKQILISVWPWDYVRYRTVAVMYIV